MPDTIQDISHGSATANSMPSLIFKTIGIIIITFAPFLITFVGPVAFQALGKLVGWTLKRKTDGRRQQLLALMREQEQRHTSPEDSRNPLGRSTGKSDWEGIVGFFHPFCNAGGGGERVLWAAIRATQIQYPKAKCVVYTGDHEVNKEQILARVKSRFNISLYPPTVTFLYLSKREFVLSETWPYFTLLGQSMGSMILAWDAFKLLVPDIFIDTMGYAFALGLCKLLFPSVATAAYVHYPTISTDMLDSLDPASKLKLGSRGVNEGQGTGIRGAVKKIYWKSFARVYGSVGSTIDVVMTNSTWTQAHIKKLWGPLRRDKDKDHPVTAVYPPCAVSEMEKEVDVSESSEKDRQPIILYLAQFRPEKDHQLIIKSFAKFIKSGTEAAKDAKLVLVGSVRDDGDSMKVYELRLLVNELHIKDRVEFHLDAPWPDVLDWLRRASVGVNGMWNEHFGIGVVEYQAAGLISVVHNSGGPKLDIVIEVDGQPTGFHATTIDEFAEGYEKALSLPNPLAMRQRARKSAKRFTEEEFVRGWLVHMDRLVVLTKMRR